MRRSTGLTFAVFFLLTAGVGIWAAYDRAAAGLKFLLVAAGLLLVPGLEWFVRDKGETAFMVLGSASAVTVVGVALSYVWLARIPSGPAANGLIILLPFILGAFVLAYKRHHLLLAILTGLSAIFGVMGLVLTMERTAWTALCLGMLGAGCMYWRLGKGNRKMFRWVWGGGLAGLFLLSIMYVAFAVSTGGHTHFLGLLVDRLYSRLSLWQDATTLIQDYCFTGSGLSSTAIVFSSYVFLLHVPFQPQAHNLLLQIAIEQGVPGLIAFLGMSVAASWMLVTSFRNRGSSVSIATVATAASLFTLIAYGLLDSEAYVSHLVSILFVPFGCVWSLSAVERPDLLRVTPFFGSMHLGVFFVVAMPLLAGASMMLWRSARAQVEANMGAVAQTRAELSVYQWPLWGVQDQVRCSNKVDLSKAIKVYGGALSVDPSNVTANRRLGQIELARGNRLKARQYLETAYMVAPEQRATRQLLGEVYAISGNIERAVTLWKSIDTSHGQLDVRRSWYEMIGAKRELSLLNEAIALLNLRGTHSKNSE